MSNPIIEPDGAKIYQHEITHSRAWLELPEVLKCEITIMANDLLGASKNDPNMQESTVLRVSLEPGTVDERKAKNNG